MNHILNILGFLLALLVLAGLVWAGYYGLMFLVGQFGSLDSDTMPVLVVASVVFFSGVLILASAIRFHARQNDRQIHPEKAVLYTRLLESLEAIGQPERNFITETTPLAKHMLLWAGIGVMEAYSRLLGELEKPKEKRGAVDKLITALVAEIRRETVQSSRGLRRDLVLNLLASTYPTAGMKPNKEY